MPRFPDAFGLENEFNGFADRVVASLGPRRVVRGVFYLLNGIAHGHGEARAATSGYKTGTVFGCDRAALPKLLSPLFSFSTKKDKHRKAKAATQGN